MYGYNYMKKIVLHRSVSHFTRRCNQARLTIQPDFFFNKDLRVFYEMVANMVAEPALTISKNEAANYPDVGLEQLVPDQFWIEEECKYDITAMYGISHWWFQRQRFYIDRFSSEGDRRAVRTHMQKGKDTTNLSEILESIDGREVDGTEKATTGQKRTNEGSVIDQAKMEMETPRSSRVNSPPNAHT
ncbi:hypothetical protein Tco_0946750 [Tanacetum coccineum]